MITAKSILDFSRLLETGYLQNISIDCVVFGYHEKQIKVLCIRMKGMKGWRLPGGFIKKRENLDDAAYRALEERTGVKELFLKQFQTFGHKDRNLKNIESIPQLQNVPVSELKKIKWMTERFVSIGYYALTEFSKVTPRQGLLDNECSWFDIHSLPPLLLDHKQIFNEALKTLQRQLHHEPVGLNLLPAKFTLPEMQALYETILYKKLDQRNFTKKLVSLNLIRKLNEKKHIGGHRSPSLYKFNKKAYTSALKEGVVLAF